MRAAKAETVAEQHTEHCATGFFTPREYRARASMPVETRHRGIYPIQLYRALAELHAGFEWPGPPASEPGHRRTWKDAYVVLYVRDPRGIKSIESSVSSQLLAGAGVPGLEQFTLREDLGAYGVHAAGEAVAFDYRMTLLGTSSLQVAPVGERNEIRIASDWPHPSFMEAWSPDERRVGREGFEAAWHLTGVATGGEATWRKTAAAAQIASARAAGVSLYDPVNVYAL